MNQNEIIPKIKTMGFVNTVGHIWKKVVDDVPYIVDFKNDQVARLEGEHLIDRCTEDPDDEMLCSLIALCYPEPTADDVTDEFENMPVQVQHQAKQIQKVDNDLTNENIRKYICPDATDQEIFMFLKLCEERHLNPFIKEAYLVKYNNSPATLIVGKDAFTKKAEENPAFDGFEAGVVVMCELTGDSNSGYTTEQRQGTLVNDNEKIIGGWAKVHRKDRKVPFFAEVSMKEYNTGMSSWKKIPATMIRKVALVQALREAFPSDLGGCYDSAEMDQARRN